MKQAAMNHLVYPLVRNALYGGGARLITLITGLIMTPYLLNRLGFERFGIWALVAVVNGLIGLLDLSFKASLVKHLAEEEALNNRRITGEILASGFYAYLVVATVVFGGLWLAIEPLTGLLHIPAGLRPEAADAFLVGAAGYLVAMVGAVFPAVFDARQRMDITNSLGIGALVVATALTIAAIEAGMGLRGLVLAQLAGILIFHGSTAVCARILYGPLGLKIGNIRVRRLKRLLTFGGTLHVSAVCSIVNRQLDKFILSRGAGLAVVGGYELAFKMASNVGSLQPYLAAALLPASSWLNSRGEDNHLRTMYCQASRYLFLIGLPPFVFLALNSRNLLEAWIGRPAPLATVLLLALIPGYTINTLSHGMANICQGMGRPRLQAEQSLLQLAANIIFSLTLFIILGPVGTALGTSLALCLGAAYFILRFNRWIGVATVDYLKQVATFPLLASMLAASMAWALLYPWSPPDRFGAVVKLAFNFGLFILAYGGFCIWTGYLKPDERRWIREFLRRQTKTKTA